MNLKITKIMSFIKEKVVIEEHYEQAEQDLNLNEEQQKQVRNIWEKE